MKTTAPVAEPVKEPVVEQKPAPVEVAPAAKVEESKIAVAEKQPEAPKAA